MVVLIIGEDGSIRRLHYTLACMLLEEMTRNYQECKVPLGLRARIPCRKSDFVRDNDSRESLVLAPEKKPTRHPRSSVENKDTMDRMNGARCTVQEQHEETEDQKPLTTDASYGFIIDTQAKTDRFNYAKRHSDLQARDYWIRAGETDATRDETPCA